MLTLLTLHPQFSSPELLGVPQLTETIALQLLLTRGIPGGGADLHHVEQDRHHRDDEQDEEGKIPQSRCHGSGTHDRRNGAQTQNPRARTGTRPMGFLNLLRAVHRLKFLPGLAGHELLGQIQEERIKIPAALGSGDPPAALVILGNAQSSLGHGTSQLGHGCSAFIITEPEVIAATGIDVHVPNSRPWEKWCLSGKSLIFRPVAWHLLEGSGRGTEDVREVALQDGAQVATLGREATSRERKETMSHIISMLETHPNDPSGLDRQKLAECIAACFECAQTCTACADACLAEDMVADLRDCIRTDLDCADICQATGRVLSRRTGQNLNTLKAMLEACRIACQECAADCEKHADMHEHCKICAEACRRCEQACADLLASIG